MAIHAGDDDSYRSILRSALAGVGGGVALALVFLSFGIIRALFSGRAMSLSPQDVRMVSYYIGGFGLAGGIVGIFHPYFRTRAGSYWIFSLAGVIVGLMIGVAKEGRLTALTPFDVVLSATLGPLYGCAFAYGMRRNRP
jgi:hypothetical protein